MIIKNAAFIFDLLTNKLSRSNALGFVNGQTAIAGLFWSKLGLLKSNSNSVCNHSVF